MPETLTPDEKSYLLKLARDSMEAAVKNQPLPDIDLKTLTPLLREKGASFVTLTEEGELRGCIGALVPQQPLAEDVQYHAVAAALEDFRFPPVRPVELPIIRIEISRLTLPQMLPYQGAQELIQKLRPNIDGVVLREGNRQATFLPQVWEELPDPNDFLAHLCQKMGSPSDLWKRRPLEVSIYQVEEFRE